MDSLVYLTSEQNAFANTDPLLFKQHIIDLFILSVSCQVKKNYRVCRFCVMKIITNTAMEKAYTLYWMFFALFIQCSALNAQNRIEISLYNNEQISIP